VDSGGSRSRIRDDLARHSDLILTVTRTAASGRKRGVQAGEGEPPSGVDSAPSRSVSTLKPSAESRPSHIGGENGGEAAGLTHVASSAASRGPDSTRGVMARSFATIARASTSRPICAEYAARKLYGLERPGWS
jgi:hypothetical protein